MLTTPVWDCLKPAEEQEVELSSLAASPPPRAEVPEMCRDCRWGARNGTLPEKIHDLQEQAQALVHTKLYSEAIELVCGINSGKSAVVVWKNLP